MKPIPTLAAAAAAFTAGAVGFRIGIHSSTYTAATLVDLGACLLVALLWFRIGRRSGLRSATEAFERLTGELAEARAQLANVFGRCDDCGEVHPFPTRHDKTKNEGLH